MIEKIPCIIDTDPGVDDAFAILYAAKHPKLDLLAITTVFGNVGLQYTSKNAQLLAGYISKEIPVALGHKQALVVRKEDAGDTHGSDGFGGRYETYKQNASTRPYHPNSVQLLKETLIESKEPVVLFPIGPLTNIASLLSAYPELKSKIRCISLMGGAFSHGNRSSAAEFNILSDPEAAQIVYESGLPIVMSGLDITDQASLSQTELERILEIGKADSKLLYDIFGLYASHDRNLHDPIAIMAITDPELFEFIDVHVDVETGGHFAVGATIPDFRSKANPNASLVKVAMKLDHSAFVDRLIEILQKDA